MPNHFHIDVVVTQEEVEIIKAEFEEYVEEAGGFSIHVMSDDEEVIPSAQLQAVLSKMYLHLLATIAFGKFQGVH
jgi:S-adenosylmethionine:diacylglycerol 3-amino-3-carboxypropyl transferase